MAREQQESAGRTPESSRGAVLTGVLLGIGVAGFVDEALLHQILQWHTFYWGTSRFGEVLSDGIFHVVTTAALLWGAARLWNDPDARRAPRRGLIVGAAVIAAGAFNLYDGLVQHLVFHFHLVNEHVCPNPHANNSIAQCPRDVPYELVFDAIALGIVLAGAVLVRRARRR